MAVSSPSRNSAQPLPAPTEPTGALGRAPANRPAQKRPRSQATRQRLLEAGRDLFAEHGPRDVTSHAIAARAGFASGTFYLHFKDKLALFRELAEDAALTLETRLQQVEADGLDAYTVMRTQAETLVGFAEEERDLLRIMFHPGSEAAGIGSGILERLAAGIAERRREAVKAGLAEACFESDVLAQAIVGMWAHVLAWWAEDPTRAKPEAIVETLTHFQLHGNRTEGAQLCCFPEDRTPEGDPSE